MRIQIGPKDVEPTEDSMANMRLATVGYANQLSECLGRSNFFGAVSVTAEFVGGQLKQVQTDVKESKR